MGRRISAYYVRRAEKSLTMSENKIIKASSNIGTVLLKGSVRNVMGGSTKKWIIRDSSMNFPPVGDEDVLYIATNQNNRAYVWDVQLTQYRLVSADIQESELKPKLDGVTILCE